ncbi:hypothetical protein M8J75_011069 [Diaphorina citri]|nr:hypothetical protein M8J75_011069 [Diaphorina citri]
MVYRCVCYATTLCHLLLLGPSSGSPLRDIIGHPYHTPPWSNEANLEENIRVMSARRAKEREKFDRLYAKELRENIAVTVTESAERSELRPDPLDSEELEACIEHRKYLAKMFDYMYEDTEVRRQRKAKNITGNVLVEKFYQPNNHRFHNGFTFTTTSTTLPPPSSTVSTLVYTLNYGFVFEEIVGLISTTPTPRRFPKPPSTEIWPWELFPENITWGSSEMKKLWQMNRYTPFLLHFTDSHYQELTTTPRCVSFEISWQYSDDPCDRKEALHIRNQTTTPKDYNSDELPVHQF